MYELLNSNNVSYIDAPVSGGELGAQSGKLSIMVGGIKMLMIKLKNLSPNKAN